MLEAGLREVGPAVGPGTGEHAAVKLWAVLHVVHEPGLGGALDEPLVVEVDEGYEQGGEAQVRLHAPLRVVLVGVALQARDGLVGTAELQRELFGGVEEVAVGVAQRHGRAQVARGVGAFHFHLEAVGLVAAGSDFAEQAVGVVLCGLDAERGEADGGQRVEVGVGGLHEALVVEAVAAGGHVGHVDALVEVGMRTRDEAQAVVVDRVGEQFFVEQRFLHDAHLAEVLAAVDARGVDARGAAEAERHVGRQGAADGVDVEGDEVVIEKIVALVAQGVDDARTFVGEAADVDRHARADERGFGIGPEGWFHLGVVEGLPPLADVVARSGMELVGDAALVALGRGQRVGRGVEVARVVHGDDHGPPAAFGLGGVEDYGGLADFAHEAGETLLAADGVGLRETVESEGDFHEREPLRVGRLAHVGAVGRGLELRVVRLDVHAGEHLLAGGEVFLRTARGERQEQGHAAERLQPFRAGAQGELPDMLYGLGHLRWAAWVGECLGRTAVAGRAAANCGSRLSRPSRCGAS